MTAPRVDLVKVGLLCRDLATEVGSLDFTGDELCALADLIEKAKEQAAENKTAFDHASITGPKTTVRIMGDGAVIK